MPSSLEAQVRVHTEFVTQEELHKFFQAKTDRYYLVLEQDAKRPHFQAYAKFKPNYENINSLRNQLKRILSGKGNGAYSITPIKKSAEHLIAYLMKEPNLIAHNLPQDLLSKAGAMYEEYQKVSKDPHRPIIEVLYDQFPPRLDAYTQEEIIDILIRYFHKVGKLQPDLYMLRKYVNTICAKQDIDRYVRTTQEEFKEKFCSSMVLWKQGFFSQD